MPHTDLPGGSVVKSPPADTRDAGVSDLIPGSGRSLEEGMAIHVSILGLENPMDRGAWWAMVHRVAQTWIRQMQLSTTWC